MYRGPVSECEEGGTFPYMNETNLFIPETSADEESKRIY